MKDEIEFSLTPPLLPLLLLFGGGMALLISTMPQWGGVASWQMVLVAGVNFVLVGALIEDWVSYRWFGVIIPIISAIYSISRLAVLGEVRLQMLVIAVQVSAAILIIQRQSKLKSKI